MTIADNLTPEQAVALGQMPPCDWCGIHACDGLCWAGDDPQQEGRQ